MAEMEEALLKRVLPHSVEAEQSVIGSMIMDREAIVVAAELLHREDFYGKQYGAVFEAIIELNDEGTAKRERRASGDQQSGIYPRPDHGPAHIGKHQILCKHRLRKGNAA